MMLVERAKPEGLAYLEAVRAKGECLSAIYLPKEGWMLPNNGEAKGEPRRLIEAHTFQ
jgi:hypothetical protein